MPCKSALTPTHNLVDGVPKEFWSRFMQLRFEGENLVSFQMQTEPQRYRPWMGAVGRSNRTQAKIQRFIEDYENGTVGHWQEVERKKWLFGVE
ncbi:hypothetical protein ABW20_dc0106599 [Dactylellina cionopaga]|nr:hypothetical protein ABW20_dc0106599 [Dactylellina cionopaga]